jgi:hypothetical protein
MYDKIKDDWHYRANVSPTMLSDDYVAFRFMEPCCVYGAGKTPLTAYKQLLAAEERYYGGPAEYV